MVDKATLTLCSANTGEYIGIPVINFPVLPVGSLVHLFISEDLCFESFRIDNYLANSKAGIQIELVPAKEEDKKYFNEFWDDLSKLCTVPKGSDWCDLYYPHVIDFGAHAHPPLEQTSPA